MEENLKHPPQWRKRAKFSPRFTHIAFGFENVAIPPWQMEQRVDFQCRSAAKSCQVCSGVGTVHILQDKFSCPAQRHLKNEASLPLDFSKKMRLAQLCLLSFRPMALPEMTHLPDAGSSENPHRMWRPAPKRNKPHLQPPSNLSQRCVQKQECQAVP